MISASIPVSGVDPSRFLGVVVDKIRLAVVITPQIPARGEGQVPPGYPLPPVTAMGHAAAP